MKIGIWGSGVISATHVTALRTLGHTVSCVVGGGSVAQFATQHHIPHHGNHWSLFLDQKVDSVHLCTPPHLHYEMIKQLLQSGVSVLCEKPLCLDLDQARTLVSLAKQHNLRCGINFNVRYLPVCQQIRDQIASDGLGGVRYLHGSYQQSFHLLPCPYGWRYDPTKGGNTRAIPEIGSHWVDLAEFFLGQAVTHVSVRAANFAPKRSLHQGMMYPEGEEGSPLAVTSEDMAMAHLQFADGTLASVVLSEVAHGRVNDLQIEVTGRDKSLWFSTQTPSLLHQSSTRDTVETTPSPFADSSFTDSFVSLFRDFYTTQTAPDLLQGAHITAVLCAMEQSVTAHGAWVNVPSL